MQYYGNPLNYNGTYRLNFNQAEYQFFDYTLIEEETRRHMELKELRLFRDAMIALAEKCDFAYKIDEKVKLPDNAIVIDSNGVRFRYKGSDRLVKNYKEDIYFFDGRKWGKVRTRHTEKVAICPK